MYDMFKVLMAGIYTVIISLILTPIIRQLAFKIGATDKPDKRRVNTKVMPTMGGIAIYLSFFLSIIILQPIDSSVYLPIFLAATIVIITGVIDDIKELNPKLKMMGLISAALVIYFIADIRMDLLSIPFLGEFHLGFFSLPMTMLWILAITNAINLIDGLDGLATGVSIIALATMSIISFFFLNTNNIPVFIMIFTLICAAMGFLPYNYFPAKIFLGDTGALFLGFMISVLSLYGLKNVTFISLVIPITILGIPITDTIYAMLRRYLNNQPITSADKDHMHHRLMSIGLTHKQSVLTIYGVAIAFSLIALLFPLTTLWGTILILFALLIGLELFVELIGLVGEDRRPLLKKISYIANKVNKNKEL